MGLLLSCGGGGDAVDALKSTVKGGGGLVSVPQGDVNDFVPGVLQIGEDHRFQGQSQNRDQASLGQTYRGKPLL